MNKKIQSIICEQKKLSPKSKKLLVFGLKLLEIKEIKNKETKTLADWLFLQNDGFWIFNKKVSFNFIVIAALFKHYPQKFSGQDLAKILKFLTDHEKEPGGPYVNEKNKLDLTTNLAIAYFLSLNKVRLPQLEKFIKQRKGKNETILDLYLIKKINQKTHNKATISRSSSKKDEFILREIIKAAKQRFAGLDDDLRKIALSEIKKTIKKNHDKQMTLISYYFQLALGRKGQMITSDFIILAGLANVFYWTAFIIYDDFWDEDEKAIPQILPAANLYARHYIDFYTHLFPENNEFRNFFNNLMDKLDTANTWETVYCRTKVIDSKFIIPEKLPNFKNYDLKFYPASGQILGPIALMLKSGFNLNSPEVSGVTIFFKNYLIAMQINDDAHDWLEDMKRGHLSTVVVMLIQDWQQKYPQRQEIDLINDLEKLQELFWFNTVKNASELTLLYTKRAGAALNNLSFLEDRAPLEHYINITKNTALKALSEQQKSLNFLKEFN